MLIALMNQEGNYGNKGTKRVTMEIRAAESFDLYVNEQHKKCPIINQGKT